MKWININEQKPTLEDCGKCFLVALKLPSNNYEYQVCEWWNPEDGEREPFFDYLESWCGQQTFNKLLTHYCEIEEISDFEKKS